MIQKKDKRFLLTVATLCAAAISWNILPAASADDVVPPWSLALEQRLQPWCSNNCEFIVPFTAEYRKDERVLVFVGVRHVFTGNNNTIRAVDAGFDKASPALVIAEGFPTAMGESPAPLIAQARTRGTADEGQYTKGEGMYAITRAITRGIPFVGGEPTRAEQVAALKNRGFSLSDIAFAYLVGSLSQSVRSGDLTGVSDPKLPESFLQSTKAFTDQYQLPALSFAEFKARYRATFNVELARDTNMIARSEPGTSSPVALLNQADMTTRDEHLLATIENEMHSKKRVLVVYGGSHWTTLSQALQRRFGSPTIEPFQLGTSSQQ